MTFQEIYTQHSKLVYNLALSYVQNREDAEEITQDVFVSVYQGLTTFREESQLSTWIYRISINKSLDFIKAKRTKKRFAIFTSLFHDSGEETGHGSHSFDHPGIQLEQKESMEFIFKQINKLPGKQKTALLLSKLEQKSQKEIADIMEISPKAAESLIQRAKQNLSQYLNIAKETK